MMESVSLERMPVTRVTWGARLAKVLAALRWAFIKNRTRMSLLDLTEEQLCDIGLTSYEAEREARRISVFSGRDW